MLGAEAALRVWERIRTGSWPVATATARYEEIRTVRALYRSRPYLGVGPREGGRAGLGDKRAAFNRRGYRSPERPLEKPVGTKRVLCAGGSTTFDLLSPSDELTWPWRLEDELRREGLAVEVWNAGFPGWTSLENLIALEARDLDLEPDLVLLYQGINDLQPAAVDSSDSSYEQSHYPLHHRALGLGAPAPNLLERSLVLERLRRWRASALSEARYPPRPNLPARARATFARNVRSFCAVARAHDATVLLVTQPLRKRPANPEADHVYLASWIPGIEVDDAVLWLDEFNDVLRREASAGRAYLADAAAEVAWQDDDFVDPMHYSRSGAEKLRAYLQPRVRERLTSP